ncbi:PP2C family protein-serine/threonine phosphatase [Streptomyces diastaticus]|uniref:PP2C family protein-serine/threonine phosphatase n=1 Tax=Streptomyces diastaticus TaxID=1956 RepID=UPI00364C9FFF
MRTYAIAKHTGARPRQCDTATVVAAPGGVRAFALLDGVGSTEEVARWTRGAAHQVAALAARHQNAGAGLRAAYAEYAARPGHDDPWVDLPHAAAVVAVTMPGRPLTVAWCGDTRAYLWTGPGVVQLTNDHNDRRVYPPHGARNILTSALGAQSTDAGLQALHGHPAVEETTYTPADSWVRLWLASDGAYEPLEDASVPLCDFLYGDLEEAARTVVESAVEAEGERADNATTLLADLYRGTHY